MSEIDEAEAFAPIDQLERTISSAAAIVCGVSLLLAALASLVFAKRLIMPIDNAVVIMKDIAEGEGDINQRLVITEQHELGEMANWFNLFIDKLQTTIAGINVSVQQLASAAEQLSTVSCSTKADIGNQHGQTEQMASAITEMTASIEQVAGNTQDAAVLANDVHQKTADGTAVVNDCRRAVDSLAQEVDRTSSVIAALHKDSAHIGQVLTVIEGIAEQTNLLALNAAIEAARAGESGRGFAVVAGEVRTLAQRTQHSTKEIQTVIHRLQVGAGEAVIAMKISQERSQNGAALAEDASKVFTTIAMALEKIKAMNQFIATAAEEQQKTSNEINRNVLTISEISEKTKQSAEEIAIASHSLADLSHHI